MSDDEKNRYRASFDPSLVKCAAGVEPVWFEVEPADIVFATANLTSTTPASRMLAFRACVRAIQLRDGRRIEPKSFEQHGPVKLAAEEWIAVAAKAIGSYRVLEIGASAASLSTLSGDDIDPLSLPAGPAPTS